MGINGGSPGQGANSEINVTPLVDVCLVLLIIFMVMVPKALPEISVRVPPDDPNPTKPQTEESLVVHVDAAGGLYLDDDAVSPAELERRLSKSLANRDRRAVFLDCSDDADFGDAVVALDIAKRAGAEVLGVTKGRNQPVPDHLAPR